MARVKIDVLRNRLPASEAGRRITEAATKALGVERSSIWAFNHDQSSIKCIDLYSTKDRAHTPGVELFAKDFPTYFAAIVTERTILADNAHKDPRTREFSAPYLTPLGINSMLDVPIWRRGRIYGVLCNEHTGPAREWDSEEEDFGYAAGSLFGLVLD
jgi:GAF domain-containing protein